MRTSPVRLVSFVFGTLLSAHMYLFVSATALGSSPLFLLEEGIVAVTGVPFGVITAATGLFLLSLALILRAPVGPGTLAVPLLFGLGTEVLQPLVPSLSGHSATTLVIRVAVLVAATHLMALGGALVLAASYGAAAIDAVMLGLSSLLRRDAARTRVVMEIAMASGGIALGGVAGFGTVLAALMVGHSFAHWSRLIGLGEAPRCRSVRDRMAHRRRTPRIRQRSRYDCIHQTSSSVKGSGAQRAPVPTAALDTRSRPGVGVT